SEKLHEELAPEAAAAQGNAEQTATSAGGGGRDTKGRFAAGNAGGPGNPFARQTAQLRAALVQRVTSEDMGVIADELIVKARNGNLAAIKLLFQYVIGKPVAAVNPDTLDVQEFREVYAPRKEIMEIGPQVVQGLPPRVLSTVVDIVNDACSEQLRKLLTLPPEQVAEATKNLAAFFLGAQPATPTPAGAANQYDDSDPLIAEINRLVYGSHDDDEEDQEEEDELNEAEQAPSTNGRKGVNRPTAAGPRPSPNGEIGLALKEAPPQPATGAKECGVPIRERCPKKGMHRGRQKKRGGRPSTNGNAATDGRDGDDRNRGGPRRCA